ncbi:hypothetical protein CDG81_03350 [Actinopolyspora erythraea]|uniref:Amine oxidase domain-containing protein n=1 Tax=Actinopolyspora erythraea TaxID=414996 RepID=A0A223RNQ6_9ACTN|nr:hypothetical protein CDG81_03350 [Actinopolyspora erythraea]
MRHHERCVVTSPSTSDEPTLRVGIVGAGMAGLTLAWLIDGPHEPVVFERGRRIGGNARSVAARVGGRPVWFDLGTQEVSAEDYPLNTRLMRLHGFEDEDFVEVPASRTVLHEGEEVPLLVGPHGPDPGWPRTKVLGRHWDRLAEFLARAQEWESTGRDWTGRSGSTRCWTRSARPNGPVPCCTRCPPRCSAVTRARRETCLPVRPRRPSSVASTVTTPRSRRTCAVAWRVWRGRWPLISTWRGSVRIPEWCGCGRTGPTTSWSTLPGRSPGSRLSYSPFPRP